MMKKLPVLSFLCLFLLLTPLYGFATEAQPAINVNKKETRVHAVISEGRLLLPLRVVCEKSGYQVHWSQQEKKVTLQGRKRQVQVFPNSSRVEVNSHQILVPEIFKSINGELHLPAYFFSDHLGLSVKWNKEENTVSVNPVVENPVEIETRREAVETETLKMTLQYPVLHGLEARQVEKNLNGLFEDIALDARSKGKEIAGYISEDVAKRGIKAEIYLDYQIKYNQHGLLSLIFTNYQYSGGAHGLTVQTSYTFDLKTGADYKLKDLFTEQTNYVKAISELVGRQMEDRGMTVFLNPFKGIRDDQDFYLDNQGLVVYFQAYEYFAYTYGIPEFTIEYSLMGNSNGISLCQKFQFLVKPAS